MHHKIEAAQIPRQNPDDMSHPEVFAAAMRATRLPMLITDPRQPDNPIVFVNDAFSRLTGYSREEAMGRNCRFLQGPGTNLDDIAKVRSAIAAREPIEIELLNYKKDGSLFWNRLLVSPVSLSDDVSYFYAVQLDVTRERSAGLSSSLDEDEGFIEKRLADLSASEDRLQFTLKAGGLGTWTLELPQQRLVASPICKANFGLSAAETFTYEKLAAAIHPDDRERWAETVSEALAKDGDLNVQYRAIWPDGSIHWIEIRAQTRYDGQGNPMLMSGVSIDITADKEAEDYRKLMTQEMSHRVKNLLATVQSVVSQSLRSDGDMESIRKAIAGRIGALARSQDILTGKKWDVAVIRQTVERAIEPFNEDGRIVFSGPEVEISQRASGALMMALHELATNAVKYGALSNQTGHVTIEWAQDGDDLVFRWTENGGPEVAMPSRSGFGSRMIERALASTIRGEATIDFRSLGVVFTMRAPIGNFA